MFPASGGEEPHLLARPLGKKEEASMWKGGKDGEARCMGMLKFLRLTEEMGLETPNIMEGLSPRSLWIPARSL